MSATRPKTTVPEPHADLSRQEIEEAINDLNGRIARARTERSRENYGNIRDRYINQLNRRGGQRNGRRRVKNRASHESSIEGERMDKFDSNLMEGRIQQGNYNASYLKMMLKQMKNNNKVGYIFLGQTSGLESDTIIKDKPWVFFFLKKMLVGYAFTHRDSVLRQSHHNYNFKIIDNLFNKYKTLPQPEDESHYNAHPEAVVEENSGILNFSLKYMNGHWDVKDPNKLANESLTYSTHTFKAKLKENDDSPVSQTTTKALMGINEFFEKSSQIPSLVDQLNSIFFNDALECKKIENKLIEFVQPGALERLRANGGYCLHYIACNKLNPPHADKKDSLRIPSTLLYSGDFAGGSTILTFIDYEVRIPIWPGSIVSFFAARINHRVDVKKNLTSKINKRYVQVLGSFEAIKNNLLRKVDMA
ncbi:hypothetical protein BCR33DRAFT_720681 [Rhizoclosmatium globosum]|uniref:Uncharacterized protein n=1 Tax=Rhizoclosmatium globosum TaxID=329046 RepID=A0A1Y2BV97_9FUNG|nr:hypothetical protein BCR33DRAFT_720681 [Rhizoclosmatium globosum]|eukprot:ORY38690.1 hypothetical protein BCR33DRAFT_720681 [Rhizoclosmatium globosum]